MSMITIELFCKTHPIFTGVIGILVGAVLSIALDPRIWIELRQRYVERRYARRK
jgi:hypothetical protein